MGIWVISLVAVLLIAVGYLGFDEAHDNYVTKEDLETAIETLNDLQVQP
jgi:hypothetical protein